MVFDQDKDAVANFHTTSAEDRRGCSWKTAIVQDLEITQALGRVIL